MKPSAGLTEDALVPHEDRRIRLAITLQGVPEQPFVLRQVAEMGANKLDDDLRNGLLIAAERGLSTAGLPDLGRLRRTTLHPDS